MLTIRNRIIAPDRPPYIIAEVGVNHDGCVATAMQLVRAAAESGADAVKFQYFSADQLISAASTLAAYQHGAASNPNVLLKKLEFSIDDLHRVVECALDSDVHAIVTVFNRALIPSIASMPCDALKTASTDLINRPLIASLITLGLPLLVSTGASTIDEVAETVEWIGDHPHLLFQCVSSYPTPDEQASLLARKALESIDPFAVGYSDHTTAIDTGALAVASGACALEKHLTHDRSAVGPDHKASLDPAQFADYVRLAHRAWRMCGRPEKRVLDIERDVREVSRQSIVATRSLPAGHRLSVSDLEVKRPGTGMSPALLDSIIGRPLARSIEANVPLMERDLA